MNLTNDEINAMTDEGQRFADFLTGREDHQPAELVQGMTDMLRALPVLRDQNARLRAVVSSCADALDNGSAISVQCSIDFMEQLPSEVRAVVSTLRDQREADAVTPDDLLRSLDKWATENTKEREILAYRDGWTNCRNAHIARAAMSAQGAKC